jgi:cobalt/nickel transport system permease protein
MNPIRSKMTDHDSSSIRDLDPRIKIISMTAFVLVIGFTPHSAYLKFLVYFLTLTTFFIAFGIHIKKLIPRLLILLPLLIFLGITVFVFGSQPSLEKLNILWNLSVKSILIFLCIGFLVLWAGILHLIKGLELLKTPPIITSVLIFAYRYISLFSGEEERMRLARKSRTFQKQNLKNKIRTLVPMMSQLFSRAFERTEKIYAAMLSRGFDRKIQTLTLFKTNKKDWIFCSVFLCYLIAVGVVL